MPSYSDVEKAMNIFKKYDDDFLEAQHDILLGPNLDTEFSEEDKETIEELGWFESDEYDCWVHHT